MPSLIDFPCFERQQKPMCSRHPQAILKKLAKPPPTATKEKLPESMIPVAYFFDYWRCPVCKTHFATSKGDQK